jgi:hypothetical protein
MCMDDRGMILAGETEELAEKSVRATSSTTNTTWTDADATRDSAVRSATNLLRHGMAHPRIIQT